MNRLNSPLCLALLAALLVEFTVPAGVVAGKHGKAEAAPAPALPPADPLLAILHKSNDRLTDPVRAAYLQWAQRTTLAELQEASQPIAADCLNEVNGNPELKDAMFAAVFPPDPSVLQNYAQLRGELGPAFLTKYRSLVIGIAMAKRLGHIDTAGEALATPPTEPQKSYYTANPAPDTDPVVKVVADFMKQGNVAAVDLYQDAASQQKLAEFLTARGISHPQITQPQERKRLAAVLKGAMIILDQRPAHGGDHPDVVAWLHYLASIYESTPSTLPLSHGKNAVPLHWPLFPMGRAPWPLLMPMSREYPLDEAQDIWNTFQGRNGPAKFITYGHYRDPQAQLLLELVPSPLYWESWEDRLVHGGECVEMSRISVESHLALAWPSITAGQPGHANLITFKCVDNAWYADVEQAYAGGPDVTHAGWLFKPESIDMPRFRKQGSECFAEYHLGLAAAMNVGLRQYISTRIAVNIFAMLDARQRESIGPALLHSAMEINPYNPEPWYLLAAQTANATQGIPLAKAAMKQDPGGADDNTPVSRTLENFVERDYAKPVESANRKYWRTLEECLTREAILHHPMPTADADARSVYYFLKTNVPGITPFDVSPYRVRFEGAAPVTEQTKPGRK